GETIVAKPANDIKIRISKGVKLSPNALQILASVKGHPKLTSSHAVGVEEEYMIDGDVDYETGHIDYEGDININGCIKSGFKVKGKNIKVLSIDDGIIEAQGDAKIAGGITSEEIFVKGNIFAKFIHKSHIVCKGDVTVDNEIIDARIENRGKCSVVNGKIISSEITSKMGIFARDIGTEKGKPSIIKVGYDIFTEQELLENKISIDEFNKVLEQMVIEQENKKEENEKIQEGISKYSQLQETSQTLKEKIVTKIDALKTSDNLKVTREKIEYPKAIKEKFSQLQADIKLSEEKLKIYFQTSKEIEKQSKELGQKIGKQKLKIKNLEFERESLVKWVKNNPGKPVVAATGAIMAKTIIQGEYSRKVLDEELRNVQVKEVRDRKPGSGPDDYKIDIIN
ncbi:MAG: DUF342 domain-containing protein, partial [Desulfobacteraceae bacterium]|nr:DUF342 domain-containing protein [Desulfobacteraceae bacterium]